MVASFNEFYIYEYKDDRDYAFKLNLVDSFPSDIVEMAKDNIFNNQIL